MKRINLLLIAASFALSSASVNAATLYGTTVDFTFDDTKLDALLGSYSVSGDTLSFWPTSFVAKMTNASIDIANATTPLITISAKPGHALSALSLTEQGDYFRIETSADTTFVGSAGQLYINDTPHSFSSVQPLNTAITPRGVANGTPFVMPWTVSESVGLKTAELATAKVSNILVAGVFSNFSAAFIETNLISIGATTMPTAVPVPAAIWMFGSCLLGVLVTGRRKIAA